MGQYYQAFNMTKKKKVSSHDLGNGAKLMEHSYIGNSFIGAVMAMLKKEWKGDRIAWVGDYHEAGEVGDVPTWEEAEDSYELVKLSAKTVKKGFLNNHTKKLSIDLSKCSLYEGGVDSGWELSPLSILTACGNGRGGGDYRGDFAFVGIWAGNEFSCTTKPEFDIVPFNMEMDFSNAQKFIVKE